MRWFDAHLDLAYLAEHGRDMTAPLNRCGGPHLPAAVTFPSLREGGIAACLGTIFTAPDDTDATGYPAGDVEAAHTAGARQLARYQDWREAGYIRPMREPAGQRAAPEPSPHCRAVVSVRLGILVENADPIRSPDELPWWIERGVVAIGLSWARPSRYAGGNATDLGLTDLGRAMVRAMDALGVVHDLSHLSEKATRELLAITDRPVVATHSNCRALVGGKDNEQWQRHLSDESIAEIGRRGGIIGLNLVRNFIRFGPGDAERPSPKEAIDHVERICDVMGHRRGVGLGSDMDGGFSADQMPAGLNGPADLPVLSDELSRRGWPDADVRAFRWDNWARFWSLGATGS